MSVCSYEKAVAALRRALAFGINPSLEGIRQLTNAMGRPQDAFDSMQVAGSNGKTSTAWLTEALLRAEGERTGLYTSPHLERYPERIEVAGRVVSDGQFATAVHAALAAADSIRPGSLGHPHGFTEFELLTAAALWHFAQDGVRVAVLEVGLGGVWDATSVVDPVTAVITGVGLDHMQILGDTVEKIAAEKAGIIKPGSAVVLGPGTSGVEYVFTDKAAAAHAPVLAVRESGTPSPFAEESTVRFTLTGRPTAPGGRSVVDVVGLHGTYSSIALAAPSHQAANVATSVAAVESTLGRPLDAQSARDALLAVAVPARFELVFEKPQVVVDGSHNPQAAEVLSEAVVEAWPDESHRPRLLLGVLADKDAEGIVRALAKVTDDISVCTPDSERALLAEELSAIVERVTGRRATTYGSVEEGLGRLLGSSPDGLVIAGSLVTAATARSMLLGLRRERAARRG